MEKYPKPLTGPYNYKIPSSLHAFTRGACSYVADPPLNWSSVTSTAKNGHGHRTPVLKGNFINPLPYEIWWDKNAVVYGVNSGATMLCYDRQGQATPYHKSATEAFKFYQSSGLYALNNNRHPYNVFTGSPTKLTNLATARITGPYRQDLDNMILLALADQTNTLAVTIAEMPKTLTFLMSKLHHLSKGVIALTKSNPKTWFRWLKNSLKSLFPNKQSLAYKKARSHLVKRPWDKRIASRWLEYNYAILPIVFDIDGVLQLNDHTTWRPIIFSLKRRHQFIHEGSNASQLCPKYMMDLKVFVGRSFHMEDPLAFALNRVGLTLPQLVFGVGWELTKFSFLFDWIVEFNNLFKSMSAMQGVTYLSGFCTVKFDIISDYKQGKIPCNGAGTLTGSLRPNPDIRALSEEYHVGMTVTQGIAQRSRVTGMQRSLLSAPPAYSYGISLARLDGIGAEYATLMSVFSQLRGLESVIKRN